MRAISNEANRVFGEIIGDRSAHLAWDEHTDHHLSAASLHAVIASPAPEADVRRLVVDAERHCPVCQAIAAVNAHRLGDHRTARTYAWRAMRSDPRRLRNMARFGLYAIEPLPSTLVTKRTELRTRHRSQVGSTPCSDEAPEL